MSRLRSSSRSHSSVSSSASTLSDLSLTPPTSQHHSYRQLTLVPQMKTIKPRASPHKTSNKPTLKLTQASDLLTHDDDASHSSSSQARKQKTLDSFLVPKSPPLTAEQRRQRRRERNERKHQQQQQQQRTTQRTAAAAVRAEDVEEIEEDVRQRRVRREAEVRERARALKEERMDSDDEEDIPLFRIAPPALPSSLPAPATPSSSSQSQSSLPSSLSSSLSSSIPSSVSPVRRMKHEDDDEWDQIPSFVLPRPLQPPPPPPPLPSPQLSAFPTSFHQTDSLVTAGGLSHRPVPPVPPPPLPTPRAAVPVVAPVNPFAQLTSVPSSVAVKAELDDAPSVRLPLSQMLQSLSEAKAAVNAAAHKPTATSVRVKRERVSPSADKENRPPTATAPPANPNKPHRARSPSPASPPPLEPATQREAVAVRRTVSNASEQSVDSISSVEEERLVMRPGRVKRERVAAPPDDIEDEHEPEQQWMTGAINRRTLFPPRNNPVQLSSSAALSAPLAGQAASSSFPLPLPQPLYQPQPLHPYNGLSSLLTSPPPFPPPPLPPQQPPPPLYAGPVGSWPLAFPEAEEVEESKQQPAGMAGNGNGYSFRGISELQGEASVNYGQLLQPKQKRKRRTSEEKEDSNSRHVKSEKKKTKKKKSSSSSKRRKSEGDADGKEEADEADERSEGREKKKKKAVSGRWCTVNGLRYYVVGNRRLTGGAAYAAYRKETEGSSSSSKKKEKKSSKKASKKSSGKKKSSKTKMEKQRKKKTDGSDSEEEWQPGDGEDSGGDEGDSGEESAGSLADFIVGDDFIEPASDDGN